MSEFFKGNMNWDYPYHDCLIISNTEGQDPITGSFTPGMNNVDAHGDQTKLFVSKRTRFTHGNVDGEEIHFNDARNVNIADFEDLWFFTSVSVIYYVIPAGGYLKIYVEGVLSEEARDAE